MKLILLFFIIKVAKYQAFALTNNIYKYKIQI